jgi:hypothetical protein
MESSGKDTAGLLARVAGRVRALGARIDDQARSLAETPEETNARRAGMPTYSRRNPNPSWGEKRPGPGDRVVGRQIVAPDSVPPPGETILGAAGALAFDREFAPAPSSDAIGVDFFAARQSLADRRIK